MNSPKKVRTYRDALERSQQSSFVGREEQRSQFRQSMELAIKDELDRPIFNVSGIGGVGKSTLLRQFRQIAQDLGGVTAYIDETERTATDIMGRFAEELERQGHKLTQFSERYKVYRQRKQELESDPEAPQGFSAFLGRSAVKLARRVPGAGVAFDFVDEEAGAELAGEWFSYVAKKLTNKDEVRLVQEPLEVLTPLFLQDISKLAEKTAITLFFDTYERTGEFLDNWLQDLINSRYGDLSLRVLIVIAGREELDKNQWALYESLIVRFPLHPFTNEEARQYLAQKSITNEDVITIILRLSGRLPLLMATLATEIPDDPSQVGEPNDTAIERFLKWVDDPKRRQVAIDAALPQCWNRDILTVLNEDAEAEALFEWLKQMPFVEERQDGWVYHEVVKTQMLRHKRRSSPLQWAALHGKLADYYDTLRNSLQLEEAEQQKDTDWQRYTLNVLYHRLCQAPQTNLAIALNEFLATLRNERIFTQRWVETLIGAGRDAGAIEVQQWGEQLVDGIEAYDEKHYDAVITVFTKLLNYASLEKQWRLIALDWRGRVFRRAKQYPQALEDLTEAIKLAPEDARYWAKRGQTYRLMKRYNEALNDLNQAIQLAPRYAWAIAQRGQVYREIRHYDKALDAFNQSIDLNPKSTWAIAVRGATYREIKHYDKALDAFNQSIDLNPQDVWAIARRGETYLILGRCNDALVEFNRAIELDASNNLNFYNRALAYYALDQKNKAQTDLDFAIQLAQQDYEKDPRNWNNTFNLALYHLTAGQIDRSRHFYRDALNRDAPLDRIHAALRDLDELLTIFPNHEQAKQFRDALQKQLETRSKFK